MRIRALFDANKHIDDVNELEKVIKDTKLKLQEWKHPDPYIPPGRPGGTKWERNLPTPNEPVVTGDW